METIVRIGLDTSKSVFQLHGVDGAEQPVLRRRLRRGQVLEFFRRLPPALVALEACNAFRKLASYRGDTAGKRSISFRRIACARPELVEIFRGNSRDDGQKARRGALLAQPVAADLAAFDRPTLLLAGSGDRLIPNSETFAIDQGLKRPETHVISKGSAMSRRSKRRNVWRRR